MEMKLDYSDVAFRNDGKLKLLIIVGTRPEIIRLAAVINKCRKYFDCILAHTGQNYDYNLNGIFFRDLGLADPDVYMNAVGDDLGATVGNIINCSYKLMTAIQPDAMLILGDTNSCLSAIAAKRLHIPIFHMEAGNRCKDECLPEETNRRIVDIISDVNLAYSEHARRYLHECGLPKERTYVTGSPMAEVLHANLNAIEASDIHQRLKNELGVKISFINLSGGVGIPYRPEQEPNDILKIGAGVHKVYDEVLTANGMGDVAIYTELGRFMMGPYGGLVTRAINEKHTYKEYVGVDACAVNLMRPAIYGAYHHVTVLGKENQPCDHKYDVTGSLCENCDKFAVDRMLPEIERGDLLFIHDAGAHGFSMGYNYNGKLKSAEILLKTDGTFQMIRRAETPKDYFATFDCFDFYNDLIKG